MTDEQIAIPVTWRRGTVTEHGELRVLRKELKRAIEFCDLPQTRVVETASEPEWEYTLLSRPIPSVLPDWDYCCDLGRAGFLYRRPKRETQ